MVNYFVINALMLIGLISITYLLYHSFSDFSMRHPVLTKILLGIVAGVAGALLMNESFETSNGVLIGYRNYTIGMSVIFGGIGAGSIAAIIMFLNRVIEIGICQTTITLFIVLLTLTIGSAIISKYTQKLIYKWTCFCLLNFAVSGLALYYLLHNETIPASLFAYFYLGHVLLAYIIYIILKLYIQFNNTYVKLSEESSRDFLTGLYNMRGFKEAFRKSIYSAVRKDERLSFLMIDIDHFKNSNDTYGHPAGDEILQQLATILTEKVRCFDVVSRNGGEEFSIILPDSPSSHAYEIAERIRQMVENHEFIVGQERIKITVSIGTSSYPEHTDNMEELVELSDKALYEAKQTGRNKVVVYSKTYNTEI